MAGSTALETLAGRPPMLEKPLRLRGVECGIEPVLRRQAALAMTASAEQLGVMAGRTLGFATVGIRRVSLDEVRRMEAPPAAARVTVGTEFLLMTPRAVERSGGGGDAML